MNPQRRLSVSAVVGAMGIVYGDIGTSPLYALESALDAAGGFDAEGVLGVLSLVFWRLTISVTLKYVTGIMRSEEHTSELQSQSNIVCRLLLEKKKDAA